MSPTTSRQRGKANPELKRSRSQGTQRKLVKAQSVASTEDPNYGGGAVFAIFKFSVHVAIMLLFTWSSLILI